MIQPSNVFKDNLAQLPAIDGIERIDLIDGKGAAVADIENKPGKQGSLAVYHYLQQAFGTLDAKAAEHGLAVFAEHTADARNRPGRTRTSTACWRSRQGRKCCTSALSPRLECVCRRVRRRLFGIRPHCASGSSI